MHIKSQNNSSYTLLRDSIHSELFTDAVKSELRQFCRRFQQYITTNEELDTKKSYSDTQINSFMTNYATRIFNAIPVYKPSVKITLIKSNVNLEEPREENAIYNLKVVQGFSSTSTLTSNRSFTVNDLVINDLSSIVNESPKGFISSETFDWDDCKTILKRFGKTRKLTDLVMPVTSVCQTELSFFEKSDKICGNDFISTKSTKIQTISIKCQQTVQKLNKSKSTQPKRRHCNIYLTGAIDKNAKTIDKSSGDSKKLFFSKSPSQRATINRLNYQSLPKDGKKDAAINTITTSISWSLSTNQKKPISQSSNRKVKSTVMLLGSNTLNSKENTKRARSMSPNNASGPKMANVSLLSNIYNKPKPDTTKKYAYRNNNNFQRPNKTTKNDTVRDHNYNIKNCAFNEKYHLGRDLSPPADRSPQAKTNSSHKKSTSVNYVKTKNRSPISFWEYSPYDRYKNLYKAESSTESQRSGGTPCNICQLKKQIYHSDYEDNISDECEESIHSQDIVNCTRCRGDLVTRPIQTNIIKPRPSRRERFFEKQNFGNLTTKVKNPKKVLPSNQFSFEHKIGISDLNNQRQFKNRVNVQNRSYCV